MGSLLQNWRVEAKKKWAAKFKKKNRVGLIIMRMQVMNPNLLQIDIPQQLEQLRPIPEILMEFLSTWYIVGSCGTKIEPEIDRIRHNHK